MDLGIQGKSTIICASSRGSGKACANSLVANGVNIVSNVRDQKTLNETASSISKKCSNINIKIVCTDVLRKVDAKLFWMFVLNQIY